MPDPLPPPPPEYPPAPLPPAASATPPESYPVRWGLAISDEQGLVLAVFAVAGAVLCVIDLLVDGRWLPGMFGMFLLVYTGIVVAGSLPARWISKRLDDVLDRWVRDKSGSGYYGLVALAFFAHAEVRGILDPEDGLFSGWRFLGTSVVEWFIGFSLGSLQNFVEAMVWPFLTFTRHGVLQTAVFGLACWAVFQVGRGFLPMPDLNKKPGDPAKKKRKRRGIPGMP